jgi:rhamnogalacturonyl hydrolase YesR
MTEMKYSIKFAKLLFTLLLIIVSNHVPLLGQEVNSIITARRVADKILRDARFQYNLTLAGKEQYGNVETIDFTRNYCSNGVAYALSSIQSDFDKEIELELGHTGALKVFVNDVEIYNATGQREIDARKFVERNLILFVKIKIPVKAGFNKVLFKSLSPKEGPWRIFLRTKESCFSLLTFSQISPKLAQYTNFLMLGVFPESVYSTSGEVEQKFNIGKIFNVGGQKTAWTVPRPELVVENAEVHQPWGEGYTAFNYHAGGVAWAMGTLGDYLNYEPYKDYIKNYCDFYIEKRPYLAYQKYQLNLFNGYDNRAVESYLLDFTSAPLLPFAHLLIGGSKTSGYTELFSEIKDYVLHKQTRTEKGNFCRITPKPLTVWTDDMYMGIPFIVQAARLAKTETEKADLLNDAVNQIFAFNSYVFDTSDCLYQHAQYIPDTVKQPYWSRANGWALWTVTHTLSFLPKGHPKYKALLEHYKCHVNSLLKYQDASGLWHNVVNEPKSYLETSGSAIFASCIATGINKGWLQKSKYQQPLLKAWKGIESQIEEDGTVKNICIGTMCSTDLNDYLKRPVCDNDTHGLFPIIFAAIEIDKMLNIKTK